MQHTDHLISIRHLLNNNIYIKFQGFKEAMKLTTFSENTSQDLLLDLHKSNIFSIVAKHMVFLSNIMALNYRDQAMYDSQ
jgi:hypothetical protein